MNKNKLMIIATTVVTGIILIFVIVLNRNYREENLYSSKELESTDNREKKDEGSEKKSELSKSDAKEKAKKILKEIYSLDVKIEDLEARREGITYQLNNDESNNIAKSIIKYKEKDGEEKFIELFGWKHEKEAEKKVKSSMKEVNNVDLESSDITYKIETIASDKNKEEYKETLKDKWTILYNNKNESYIIMFDIKTGEVLQLLSGEGNQGIKMDSKTKKENINEVLSPLLKVIDMDIDDYEIRRFDDKSKVFTFVNKSKSDDVFIVSIDSYNKSVIRFDRNYKLNLFEQ